jgi:hypothetical protein
MKRGLKRPQEKGRKGENEFAARCQDRLGHHGTDYRRTAGSGAFFGLEGDVRDFARVSPVVFEAKRTEHLRLRDAWRQAVNACRVSGAHFVPAIAWRPNKAHDTFKNWMVVLDAEMFFDLLDAYLTIKGGLGG